MRASGIRTLSTIHDGCSPTSDAASRPLPRDLRMILNRQRAVGVSPAQLSRFLARVQRTLRLTKDSVAVCLIEDREIARLNQKYRRKRGSTDVLSFPVNGNRKPGRNGKGTSRAAFLGDIAISPAVARRNARDGGRPTSEELRILILHGVLHLLGYDHETDNGQMERYEARLRRKLGLAK